MGIMLVAGELRPRIGMENAESAEPGDGPAQHRDAKPPERVRQLSGQRCHNPMKSLNSVLVRLRYLTVTCPRERRASDARDHFVRPRLVREQHEDITRMSAAACSLDLLVAVVMTPRLQRHFAGLGWV